MKLNKCYNSSKFKNSVICEGMPYEQVDPVTGEKSQTARKYLSLQSKEDIQKLMQSGSELEWKATKHEATGFTTYEFSIKK